MTAHFERAFWPITAMAAFFGLALIEYPLGTPRRFFSLIYATLAVSVQVGMYMMFRMLETRFVIMVKWIMDFIMLYCNFIILASIFLTYWHGKRYHKCMERFNEVDETLRVLEIETDYSKLRRMALFALIMWAIIYIVINGYIYVHYLILFSDMRTALLQFVLAMPLHIRMLTNMQFWSVLGYSGTRFDYFSSALSKLTIDDSNHASGFRNSKLISVRGTFIPDERARRIIWTVMHLHFELSEILRDVNTVFEIQMSFQMSCDYVSLLCSVIFTFRLILMPVKYSTFQIAMVILLWALPFLADVIVTNHLCEIVGVKARTVCDMGVQLLRLMDDEGMREDVSLIVLQAKLRPLEFSCLGLYNFGYNFIYKIFSTVATTAVIVLQLKAGLQF